MTRTTIAVFALFAALLLHPLGKIISINTNNNKLEVLDLPPAATTDANAPLSQVRSGVGTREGLMDGPIHAAITAQGAILILEQNNNRIQAFDIGEILGVKGRYSGECSSVGGQSAIGGWYAYHHAPVAIEIVAEAHVVPLGIESLV